MTEKIVPLTAGKKPVFGTATEALLALSLDRLGTIYYRADGVYVVTAHGSGTFTHAQWRAARGPENSMKGKER